MQHGQQGRSFGRGRGIRRDPQEASVFLPSQLGPQVANSISPQASQHVARSPVKEPAFRAKPERTILIENLPPNTEPEELEQFLRNDCRGLDADSFEVCVQITGGDTVGRTVSAKAAFSEMKPVIDLWKRRHLAVTHSARSLVFKKTPLKWDIAEKVIFLDDQFIIEKIPGHLTEDQVIMRIQVCQNFLEDVTLKSIFFNETDHFKQCIIYLSEPVVDKNLVDNLNQFAAPEFECEEPPIFKCVSQNRSVLLTELKPETSEGDVRLHFHSLSLLVEDVKAIAATSSNSKSFVVTFRRQSDMDNAYTNAREPILGQKPVIEKHYRYPLWSESAAALDNDSPPGSFYSLSNDDDDDKKDSEFLICCLTSDDESQLNPDIVNFIWKDSKRQRALKRALGNNFAVQWDSENKQLLIERKHSESAESDWKEGCQENFLQHQDQYECKPLQVQRQFLEQLSQVVQAEEENSAGDVTIREETQDSKISKLLVIGKTTAAEGAFQRLRMAKQRIEEEEATASFCIKVNSDSQDAVQNSQKYRALCQTRPEACFEFNKKTQSLQVHLPAKHLTRVKEEANEVVNAFGAVQIEMQPDFGNYFAQKGFLSLNAKLSKVCSGAKAVGISEDGMLLNLVCEKESFERVKKCVGLELTVCRVASVNDGEEVQESIHTRKFASFIRASLDSRDVVLFPSLKELSALTSERGSALASLHVIGDTSDAELVATQIGSFLETNVIYSLKASLPSRAHAKFLRKFLKKEIKQIETRYDATVQFHGPMGSQLVNLRANQHALPRLKEELSKLVNEIKVKSEKIVKHGLERYVKSEEFTIAKNLAESKYAVMVSTSLDPEGAFTPGTLESSEKLAGLISEKLGEFASTQDSAKSIVFAKGDICDYGVDAIVNAANEELKHVGGLAKVIKQRAGPELEKECKKFLQEKGNLPTGHAMVTTAGMLPKTKHVIHAVGPRWPSEDFTNTVELAQAERDLESAVESSLKLASQRNCKSVAIPAISSGVYGWPSHACAKRIVKAAVAYLSESTGSVTEVHLIMHPGDKNNIAAFQKELKQHSGLKEKQARKEPLIIPGTAKSCFSFTELIPEQERAVQPAASSLAMTEKPSSSSESVSSFVGSVHVVVKQGSITDEQVDVIVNSTNSSLDLNSAKASKTLLEAAGIGLQKACSEHVKTNGKISESDVVVTSGFLLSCTSVFHICCSRKPQALAALVTSCLKKASSLGISSISIPALGTGTLGLTDATSARAIFDGIRNFDAAQEVQSSIQNVHIVIYDRIRVPTFLAEQSGSLPSSTITRVLATVISANQVKLPNGCDVTVKQGDVITSTADVIVFPTNNSLALSNGVVAPKVLAAAGTALSSDASLNYSGGIPWGETASLNAGNLPSKRAYALATRAWDTNTNQAANIATLRQSVLECIVKANTAGYTSISIPALGTGSLNYSDKQSATAIFEAAAEFSSQTSSCTLKNVYVLIFDSHRLSEFTSELNSCLVAGSTRTDGNAEGTSSRNRSGITGMINRFFGRVGHTSPSAKSTGVVAIGHTVFTSESARNLETVEPDATDVVEVAVVGEIYSLAMKDLIKAINAACVKEEVRGKYPENLDPEAVKRMKRLALREHAFLSVKVHMQNIKIFLAGWKKDIHEAQKVVNEELLKQWSKHNDTVVARAERKSKISNICWSRFCKKGFLPYDDEISTAIEEAFLEGHSLEIKHDSVTYIADPKNRKLTSKSTRELVDLRREVVNEGVHLPSMWTEPSAKNPCEMVVLPKSSWEYLEVEKKFRATLGRHKAQIVSIQRIQNRRLYFAYVKEKEEVQEKLARHGKTSSKSVELELWHGTKEEAVEHITVKGFNRSLAGSNVGRKLGFGVYFAVNSSYSFTYASLSVGQQRNMFLCKVLVGQYTLGKLDLLELPLMNESVSSVDRFDSAVDNLTTPTIFSSCFRDHQAYPDYLITFK